LERGLKRLAKGDFTQSIHIRDTDELSDLIQSFEEVKLELQNRIEIYDKTALLLTHELDHLLANITPENIETLRRKLKKIRDEVVKKAA